MAEPEPSAAESAQEARLALAQALQGLLVHELGNPLQSLSVLVELTHEELAERGDERSATRLARALESLERLRHLLHEAGSIRSILLGRGDEPRGWGVVVEHVLGLLADRLRRLRITVRSDITAIAELPIPPGALREALLACVLEACDQVRRDHLEDASLVLEGRIVHGVAGLCLGLRAGEERRSLGEGGFEARLEALLAEATGRVTREGGELILWTA